MDWSSSPTAKTLPCAPSARTSSYWARLVSWNSSTRMKAKRSRHQARRSGYSRKRTSGKSIRSSKSIAFCRLSAAASGSISSAATWVSRSKPAEAGRCWALIMRFLAPEMTAWTARGGKSLAGTFRSSSSRRISPRRSSSSKMVNCRLQPSRSASRRSRRAERLWNVPIQSPAGSRSSRVATRSFISPAALLVNVTAKIRSARTPCSSISTAIRVVSTRVLPEPAPASTRSGPSTWATASRCSGFKALAQSRPAGPAIISAGEETVRTDVGYQRLGKPDRTVGGLIVLQQRGDRPRERDPGRIEGMDELRPGTRRGTEPDPGPAGLEVGERAGARAFQPGPDARGPHLEIVGTRRAETRIAGGELDHPVRKAEPPEHRLGVAGEELVLGVARLWAAEADQLHLVELVHPEEPAGVLARGAGIPAEAGREGHERRGQRGRVEDLVAVQVGDRHLGGGNEEEIVPGNFVLVFFELGQLPRAGERGAVDQQRRRLEVAVLPGMKIKHEARERPHQPGARAGEEGKARARDLRPARQVENPERFAELPVRFRSELEGRRLAHGADHPVRRRGPGGTRGVGQVGKAKQRLVELVLELPGLGVERLHPLARRLEGGEELLGGLLVPLSPGHFLGLRVPLRLEPLGVGHHGAPAPVQVEHRVHRLPHPLVAPAHQGRAGRRRILAQELEVDHFLGSPTSSPR